MEFVLHNMWISQELCVNTGFFYKLFFFEKCQESIVLKGFRERTYINFKFICALSITFPGEEVCRWGGSGLQPQPSHGYFPSILFYMHLGFSKARTIAAP